MKTIKQIADEVGVSKQAIRNQIAKLGLQSSLQKNGNQLAIDEQQERLILQEFGEKSQSGNAKQSQSETETTLHFALRLLEDEIAFLKEQVKTKDEQITELTATVRTQAESINADRKNELAGTLIDGQQKLISSEETRAWWQFWKKDKS